MTMFKIPMRFKKQAGYILLEGALALSMAAGIMTYYMAEEKNRFAEDMAKLHGQHMKAIASATNAYITNNYGALLTGGVITIPSGGTVADRLAPTVQELADLGFLPNGAGMANPVYGGGFRIQLVVNTATDTVNGFVGTTAPVAPGGQVSNRAIGRALEEIGINGMATGLGNNANSMLVSHNGITSIDVTTALGLPAQQGLMAVRVGTGTCDDGTGLACDVFLRRDGTRPMTGDLNMGTRNIFDANNITAELNITATTGNIEATTGNIEATNGSVTAGRDVTADQNITATNGNIEAKKGDVIAGQDVTANRNITATTGNIEAKKGDVIAGQDVTANRNITATNGNIEAKKGDVIAGQDVTANRNITATTGNIEAKKGDVIAGQDVTANRNITATTGNIEAKKGDVIAGQDLIATRNLGTPEKRVQKIYAKDLDLSGDIVAENITARNKLKTKDLEVTGVVTNTLNMGNGANLNMGQNDIKNVKDIGEDSVLGRVKNIYANILNVVTAYIKDLHVTGLVKTDLTMDVNKSIKNATLVDTKTLTASTVVDTNNLKVTGQVLAALNMGGNDINNAKNIAATGNMTANGDMTAAKVYTTDLSVTGNVLTNLKMGSNNSNNAGNNNITHVNTIRARAIHMEDDPTCHDTHSLNENKDCRGAIKSGFVKVTGNTDIHRNLYLGQPGSTQMRLGDIPGGTSYWASSCPANTVMVGVHSCSISSGSGWGGGTAPKDGGWVSVSVSVSGSVNCYAVCAPIAPAKVPDF
jgi:ribosomal protein S17